MLLNRTIKLEEEDYPLSERSLENGLFNHCLTTFYNDDSAQEIIHTRCNVHEVMKFLQYNVDLCDTPLSSIIRLVQMHPNFKNVDLDLVKRRVVKQKNIMKRFRAKNRHNQFIPSKQISIDVAIGETEQQFKKKRNRISAQISRDRKKEKVKQLQQLTQKLRSQCDETKLENARLKKQMAEQSKKHFSIQETVNSKFMKLLILLGIIFLVGIIRDIFSSESESSNSSLLKITEANYEKGKMIPENFYTSPSYGDRQKIFESIESPLEEMIEEKNLLVKVRQRVAKGLQLWKDSENWLTNPMKQGIERAKDLLLY